MLDVVAGDARVFTRREGGLGEEVPTGSVGVAPEVGEADSGDSYASHTRTSMRVRLKDLPNAAAGREYSVTVLPILGQLTDIFNMADVNTAVMASGTVYAVAGAKGGVGKTTTSLNLGAALTASDRSVVVVELDLAMANVADFLALDVDPETDTTLHDVLAGDADVSEALYDADDGFAVVPSGTSLDGFAAIEVDRIGRVLDTLRERYDVLILDTGAGLSHETLLPLALAAETVLVSSPRVASVRDVEKTKQLTERVGGTVAGAVFVRSGTGNSPPVDRIAGFLDVPLLGHVPDDDAVPASQDVGRPVVTHAPDSPAAEAYRSIADNLLRRDVTAPDAERVASNAIRARAETARHRDGFVFPESESDEAEKSEERASTETGESAEATDTGTDVGGDGEVDRGSEEAPLGDDRDGSTPDTDDGGLAEDAEDPDDGDTLTDADDERPDTPLTSVGVAGTSTSITSASETRRAGDRDGRDTVESLNSTDGGGDGDEDEKRPDADDEAGLRGRLGAVVKAVRGPF
jgi:septum site-determining protein MinD